MEKPKPSNTDEIVTVLKPPLFYKHLFIYILAFRVFKQIIVLISNYLDLFINSKCQTIEAICEEVFLKA